MAKAEEFKMKLRLLMFELCNRNCAGCCNKDWDLSSLPIIDSYEGYSEIYLTGGEPMLRQKWVISTICKIRKETSAKVIMYSAKCDEYLAFLAVLSLLDGVTLTLHEQRDVGPYISLQNILLLHPQANKSLRLNVFQGVNLDGVNTQGWKVKENMVWIKNCPLPEGEVLMRL